MHAEHSKIEVVAYKSHGGRPDWDRLLPQHAGAHFTDARSVEGWVHLFSRFRCLWRSGIAKVLTDNPATTFGEPLPQGGFELETPRLGVVSTNHYTTW